MAASHASSSTKSSTNSVLKKTVKAEFSGFQRWSLAEFFRELSHQQIIVDSLQMKLRSQDGKGRVFIKEKSNGTPYPVTIGSSLKEVEFPINKNLLFPLEQKIEFKGSFYLESLQIKYHIEGDKSLL